ncbi:hypothetical protein ACHQM5_018718 [Ranunculus cassubicifolius]
MASMMDKAKLFVAEKVAHIKKPEAELTDVDLKNVSRDAAHFKSQIDVTNPYDHSIPICEIAYSLKSANKEIASENGVTALDMDMKVPYSVLVDLAKDIGADWDIDYHLVVKFTVDLPVFGNFTIPLERKGEFKLPSISSLFGM